MKSFFPTRSRSLLSHVFYGSSRVEIYRAVYIISKYSVACIPSRHCSFDDSSISEILENAGTIERESKTNPTTLFLLMRPAPYWKQRVSVVCERINSISQLGHNYNRKPVYGHFRSRCLFKNVGTKKHVEEIPHYLLRARLYVRSNVAGKISCIPCGRSGEKQYSQNERSRDV